MSSIHEIHSTRESLFAAAVCDLLSDAIDYIPATFYALHSDAYTCSAQVAHEAHANGNHAVQCMMPGYLLDASIFHFEAMEAEWSALREAGFTGSFLVRSEWPLYDNRDAVFGWRTCVVPYLTIGAALSAEREPDMDGGASLLCDGCEVPSELQCDASAFVGPMPFDPCPF